jgi:putative PIG3 family NAD(P)H quinone oxidoreductase
MAEIKVLQRKMKAAWITRFGGPEVLEVREVDRPHIDAAQVLVRVHASSLNRADLLQRQGKYPPPPGYPVEIPGMEFAGEVAEVGSAAGKWKPGQRVFGLLGGAGQAEFIATHEDLLAEIPEGMSWVDAAAIPEAFITAHDALWTQAQLRPGETVLINAVGSGVGLAAVQLVRALHAVPFGTSRTADKIDQAKAHGLEKGLVVRENFDELVTAAEQWTGGKGINVVLDLVGGPYVRACQKLLAFKGRMMLVGTVGGGNYELDARSMLSKRLTVRGTVLRARTLDEKIQVTRLFAQEVVPLFAQRRLRTTIDSTFKLTDIAKAHARLESNESVGKVVIEV